ALKGRRLTGERTLDVTFQVACVQFAAAVEVTRRSHAESEIGLIRPVHLVVARAASRQGEVGNLVVLEPGCLQRVDASRIQGQFLLLAERDDLAAATPLP